MYRFIVFKVKKYFDKIPYNVLLWEVQLLYAISDIVVVCHHFSSFLSIFSVELFKMFVHYTIRQFLRISRWIRTTKNLLSVQNVRKCESFNFLYEISINLEDLKLSIQRVYKSLTCLLCFQTIHHKTTHLNVFLVKAIVKLSGVYKFRMN